MLLSGIFVCHPPSRVRHDWSVLTHMHVCTHAHTPSPIGLCLSVPLVMKPSLTTLSKAATSLSLGLLYLPYSVLFFSVFYPLTYNMFFFGLLFISPLYNESSHRQRFLSAFLIVAYSVLDWWLTQNGIQYKFAEHTWIHKLLKQACYFSFLLCFYLVLFFSA